MSNLILRTLNRAAKVQPSTLVRAFSSSSTNKIIDQSYGLTSDEKQLQDTALQFALKELRPFMSEWDAKEYFPRDVLKKCCELGFGGLYVPTEDGGSGLSRLETTVVFEALSQGCIPTTAMLSIHNMPVNMLSQYGSAELKKRFLPGLISFDKMASYCLTEPGSGSDSSSLTTTAIRKGDHYVMNGTKAFISGGGVSDVFFVMCRTGGDGPKGISCIAVEKGTPGLSYGKKERKLGWNAQPTSFVIFEDCKVPVANLLGEEGKGFNYAMNGINGGRLNIAAGSLGGAQYAMEETIKYVSERKQFKKELITFQNIQFKLADYATDLLASRLIVRAAARRFDEDLGMASPEVDNRHVPLPPMCAAAKYFATEKCYQIIDGCLQMHGGYGYLKDFPIEQLLRDTRVHRILEGSSEMMQLIMARDLARK